MKDIQFIFDEFKAYYPMEARRVVRWEYIGNSEIALKFDDDTIHVYNFLESDLRYANKPNGDKYSDVSEEELTYEFSKRLHSRMLYLGINQIKLSEMTGISQGAISSYIRGLHVPNLYTLMKLSKALKCDPSDLFYQDVFKD